MLKLPREFTLEKKPIVWCRDEAVALCAHLWKALDPVFHVGLTGGCLYRGHSTKDVDIIIYPRNEPGAGFSVDRARKMLTAAGLKFIREPATDPSGSRWAHRLVEVWEWEGKRVDVFFFNGDFVDIAAEADKEQDE
jgi:hypothetical protein